MVGSRTDDASYHALRVCDTASAVEWWAQAHERSRSAPAPIRALLAGRTRIELTAEEAVRAIEWASRLPGWSLDGQPPLIVHSPSARHN